MRTLNTHPNCPPTVSKNSDGTFTAHDIGEMLDWLAGSHGDSGVLKMLAPMKAVDTGRVSGVEPDVSVSLGSYEVCVV